ncbi:MAG TPA: hypothetical protein VM120_28365 [Bryobacteraceae bacterium]|nr:hypothetical protein [Bryobacteraceae bacterium]
MRGFFGMVLLMAVPQAGAAGKLTDDERMELFRGLTAEFATLKTALPRAKKPLAVNSDGTYDKQQWEQALKEMGPAGRLGDLIQITKVDIESDKILFQINGGLKTGRKWYERVEVGMGNRTSPVGGNGNPTLGSSIVLLFPKGVPAVAASDIKKILLPIMDFEKRSATEQYVTTLPPEVQQAVKEGRVVEGMDRDGVILAMGRPRNKSRETKEGVDYEDWVYGNPPGKMTFITFMGSKVVKVKEAYAGLGGSTAPPLPAR